MLCWLNNWHMLCLSNPLQPAFLVTPILTRKAASFVCHNDELNNQAWMREMCGNVYRCKGYMCTIECWLNHPRVVSVIFTYSYSDFLDHKPLQVCSKGLWSKKSESEYEYLLLTTLGYWIYEWMATFSTFDAMSRWLHFLGECSYHVFRSQLVTPHQKGRFLLLGWHISYFLPISDICIELISDIQYCISVSTFLPECRLLAESKNVGCWISAVDNWYPIPTRNRLNLKRICAITSPHVMDNFDWAVHLSLIYIFVIREMQCAHNTQKY